MLNNVQTTDWKKKHGQFYEDNVQICTTVLFVNINFKTICFECAAKSPISAPGPNITSHKKHVLLLLSTSHASL